jgi:cytochrome P450
MHPIKYTEGDDPVEVSLPDMELLLRGSWKEKDSGTVGEFDLRMTLEAFITPSEITEEAAAGWGGDKYAYLKNDDGEKLLVIYSTWDTLDDAQEFFDLYEANRTDENWASVVDQSDKHTWENDDQYLHLEYIDGYVLLINAPNATTANLVRNAVLP